MRAEGFGGSRHWRLLRSTAEAAQRQRAEVYQIRNPLRSSRCRGGYVPRHPAFPRGATTSGERPLSALLDTAFTLAAARYCPNGAA